MCKITSMCKAIRTALATVLLAAREGKAEELSIASSTTVANAVLHPCKAQIEQMFGHKRPIREALHAITLYEKAGV